jgi:hypothetical protein
MYSALHRRYILLEICFLLQCIESVVLLFSLSYLGNVNYIIHQVSSLTISLVATQQQYYPTDNEYVP